MDLKVKRSFLIVELDDGSFLIQEKTGASVWPETAKPNAREMIARLMQLCDIGPVAPQTEPERICIGVEQNTPGQAKE